MEMRLQRKGLRLRDWGKEDCQDCDTVWNVQKQSLWGPKELLVPLMEQKRELI